MESKLEREVQTMLYQCQAGLRVISPLGTCSSPTGGATDKPTALLPFPEELETVLLSDIFKACFD